MNMLMYMYLYIHIQYKTYIFTHITHKQGKEMNLKISNISGAGKSL